MVSAVVDKVAGLLKGGRKDAVDLLKADHDVVEKLFEKVKANEDGNNAATFRKIKNELETHTHIEETVFYPMLLEKGDEELKKIVREGIEEHHQVKMFLEELPSLSGDAAKFKAKMMVLIEDVEHHVKEEEDEMFPMVRDQFDEATLRKLASRLEKAKIRYKEKNIKPAAAKLRAATAA